MPAKSEKQLKAMYAAAGGHSTLGIPTSVGSEFVGKNPVNDAEHWISTETNSHLLIDGNEGQGYVIKGGASGKLNGTKVNPQTISAPRLNQKTSQFNNPDFKPYEKGANKINVAPQTDLRGSKFQNAEWLRKTGQSPKLMEQYEKTQNTKAANEIKKTLELRKQLGHSDLIRNPTIEEWRNAGKEKQAQLLNKLTKNNSSSEKPLTYAQQKIKEISEKLSEEKNNNKNNVNNNIINLQGIFGFGNGIKKTAGIQKKGHVHIFPE